MKVRSTTVPGPTWAIGQTETPTVAQTVTSLLPALTTAGRQYEKAAPIVDFVLEHPWMTVLLMGVWMSAMAAAGTYIVLEAEKRGR